MQRSFQSPLRNRQRALWEKVITWHRLWWASQSQLATTRHLVVGSIPPPFIPSASTPNGLWTSDGNKTKMLRPRPRPIKQQQDYMTKKLFCCNTHFCCQKITLFRKRQKVIWWPVIRLALFLHLLHEKIQVFIAFQHYHVTRRLSGTTVLEARPKV